MKRGTKITIPWSLSDTGILEVEINKLIDVPMSDGTMIRLAIHRVPDQPEYWQCSVVESGSKFGYNYFTRYMVIENSTFKAGKLCSKRYRRVTDAGIKKVKEFRLAAEANRHLLEIKL